MNVNSAANNVNLAGSSLAGLILGVLSWKFGVDLSGFEAQASTLAGWFLALFVGQQSQP